MCILIGGAFGVPHGMHKIDALLPKTHLPSCYHSKDLSVRHACVHAHGYLYFFIVCTAVMYCSCLCSARAIEMHAFLHAKGLTSHQVACITLQCMYYASPGMHHTACMHCMAWHALQAGKQDILLHACNVRRSEPAMHSQQCSTVSNS